MANPDVLNYFLVVLGGFAFVWCFRKISGRRESRLGEFEYAAFSTIWGIPVFLLFSWIERGRPDLLNAVVEFPMMATPALVILGGVLGAGTALLLIALNTLWASLWGKI